MELSEFRESNKYKNEAQLGSISRFKGFHEGLAQ